MAERKTISLGPPSADRLERLAMYYDLRPSAVIRVLIAERFGELFGPELPTDAVFKLPVTLEPAEEGGYIVTSPVLEGLITEGDTLIEALIHAQEAACGLIEVMHEKGLPLPEEWRDIDPTQPFGVEVVLQ